MAKRRMRRCGVSTRYFLLGGRNDEGQRDAMQRCDGPSSELTVASPPSPLLHLATFFVDSPQKGDLVEPVRQSRLSGHRSYFCFGGTPFRSIVCIAWSRRSGGIPLRLPCRVTFLFRILRLAGRFTRGPRSVLVSRDLPLAVPEQEAPRRGRNLFLYFLPNRACESAVNPPTVEDPRSKSDRHPKDFFLGRKRSLLTLADPLLSCENCPTAVPRLKADALPAS